MDDPLAKKIITLLQSKHCGTMVTTHIKGRIG